MSHVGGIRFRCCTAGRPGETAGQPHPLVGQTLSIASIPADLTASQPWSRYMKAGAPRMDLAIVLDADMAPLIPRFPGFPELAVWALPDLLAHAEPRPSEAVQMLHLLRRRLEILASLPLRHPDRAALRSDIRDLAYR